MIPPAFEYVRPASVDEAVRTLGDAGEDAKVLAGGQSLLPLLRLRLAFPELVVDVGRIPGLRGVREDGGTLVIGALTTHHDVLADPLVRRHAGLLAAATATVADPAIRHRGTLGGSLAHADPRVICRRWRSHWTRSWSRRGPGANGPSPQGSSSWTTSRPRCGRTSC